MDYYIKKQRHLNQDKLRRLNEKNPKKYWKFLNNLKSKDKNSRSPSIQEFYDHFKSVNENTIIDDRFDNLRPTSDSNQFLNSPITEEEILKCIQSLSNSKAPSPHDNIINEYIKTTKHILMPIYINLFNSILETGHIPNTWLEGVLSLFLKIKVTPKIQVVSYPV